MDEKWLQEIGVTGTDEELRELAEQIQAALELRVGDKISQELTAEQLQEAEKLMDNTGEIPIDWLEKVYPDYQKVVDSETTALRQAITEASDKPRYIRGLKI